MSELYDRVIRGLQDENHALRARMQNQDACAARLGQENVRLADENAQLRAALEPIQESVRGRLMRAAIDYERAAKALRRQIDDIDRRSGEPSQRRGHERRAPPGL